MSKRKKEEADLLTSAREPVPCCPPLEKEVTCDVLNFHYRLINPTQVVIDDQRRNIQVEAIINTRLERCTGPLTLGDLIYSTTLLPGEKVRLFTADRRTSFSFERETQVSYRSVQTQEEHYYMSSMSEFMSDLSVRDVARSHNKTKGHYDTHAETSGILSSIFGSPSIDVSGNYNGESTSEFLRELSQHARASHHHSVMATRAASSVSIGEVQTRIHAEGETQDHFESSSRVFSNPNKCHAITFNFYKINKTQTIKFTIDSIERRVIDPAADTKVTNNPFASKGNISTIPSSVLATDTKRLEIEGIGRASVEAQKRVESPQMVGMVATIAPLTAVGLQQAQPLQASIRKQALKQVDEQLVAAGLLDKVSGQISTEAKKFSFELVSSLPTPGLLVKGCLDVCNICDEARIREIELEFAHKELENEMLKRQIELLDKAQEYRCCPPDTNQSNSP